MEATYRFCVDTAFKEEQPQPWLEPIERYNDTLTRLDHAAAELRKLRLRDSIGQQYDLGFYDGIEEAISVIKQALKD